MAASPGLRSELTLSALWSVNHDETRLHAAQPSVALVGTISCRLLRHPCFTFSGTGYPNLTVEHSRRSRACPGDHRAGH